MADVKLTRDHHLLTRNLKLNNKYISNDGEDEGISINDLGTVAISGTLDISSNMSIAQNEIDISTGDLLLDVAGTINMDSDTGNVTFKKATVSGITIALNAGGLNVLGIANPADAADVFAIRVGAEGATSIVTTDDGGAVGHLTLDIDIILDADAGTITLEDNGTNELEFGNSSGTWTVKNKTSDADIIFNVNDNTVDTEVMRLDGSESSLLIASGKKIEFNNANNFIYGVNDLFVEGGRHLNLTADVGDVVIDAGGGTITLQDDGSTYTPSADSDAATKKYVDDNAGGTTTWQITRAAYKTNNNSTINYYFPYYSTATFWTSYDSSPTSLSYSKDTGYIWRADANGTLTNIKGTVRALDTGLTDPVRFYVYKATLPTDSATITATLIGTSDATAPIASRTVTFSTDISSSNDFDAGQVLYVMYKKDSTSGNQDLYFSVTISGEYD